MEKTAAKYQVLPVHGKMGESQADAVRKIVVDMCSKGFEIVEACGDEIRQPSLIFVQREDANSQTYLVDEVPHAKGHGEVDDIRDALWKMHDEGWRVLTVLDSPLSPPVAIYRKEPQTDKDLLKVLIIPVHIMSNTAETIKQEITQQEVRNNCRLQTVMNSGLAPVLILLTHPGEPEIEYLIEHAKGGLFTNQTKKLQDLIDLRAKDGWVVCGAFEDELFMPCVVFSREAQPGA